MTNIKKNRILTILKGWTAIIFLVECPPLTQFVNSISIFSSPAISYNNFVMHPTPLDNYTIKGAPHGLFPGFHRPKIQSQSQSPAQQLTPISPFRQYKFRPQDARRLPPPSVSVVGNGLGLGLGHGHGHGHPSSPWIPIDTSGGSTGPTGPTGPTGGSTSASAPAPAPFFGPGPRDEMLDKFLEMVNLVDDMADKKARGPVGQVIDKHAEMAEIVSSTSSKREKLKQREKPHNCYRRCSTDPGSFMTCGYNFTVANYYILSPHCMECPNVTADCYRHGCVSADGRARAIAVVNKMLPGPSIQVCEGDTVVVDVLNKLTGQETTIHWHGIHQDDTPWMDGVPHVTQCPISMGSTMRYQFEVPKAGTYFWHSHHGAQRADGVVGKLIIRRAPEIDVHANLFDFDLAEHEILVMDWLSDLAIVAHTTGHVTDMRELPRSILVNGKGIPPGFYDDFRSFETLQSKRKPFVPLHEVRVEQNFSYRFRLISNGVTLCPIEVSIDSHSLLVIASDGFDISPVPVQSLVIHAGERYDFVVRADQPIGSYWMKFRGLIDCNMTGTYQVAVLNYEGTVPGALPGNTIKTWDEAGPGAQGVQLNPVNVAPGTPGESITVAELSSVIDDDPEIIEQERADHQFYLSFDFNPVPDVNFGKPAKNKTLRQLMRERIRIIHFLPQLNFISHAMPISPPLIQPETIPALDRCNFETKMAAGVNCTDKQCKCTHWLNVKLNSIVEIVLVDMGVNFDAAHPFHLHGHSFRVVAIEKLGNTTRPEIVKAWDQQGLIPRRRQNAPIKDTVYVPDGGYTIVRFRADNPGYWFFHCHIEFHAERGMALIFQVGQQNEIPRAPSNFPRCGDYVPPIDGPSASSSSAFGNVYNGGGRYLRSAKIQHKK